MFVCNPELCAKIWYDIFRFVWLKSNSAAECTSAAFNLFFLFCIENAWQWWSSILLNCKWCYSLILQKKCSLSLVSLLRVLLQLCFILWGEKYNYMAISSFLDVFRHVPCVQSNFLLPFTILTSAWLNSSSSAIDEDFAIHILRKSVHQQDYTVDEKYV